MPRTLVRLLELIALDEAEAEVKDEKELEPHTMCCKRKAKYEVCGGSNLSTSK